MLSGYYAAATGLVTQGIAMNHLSANIANAEVAGYKKQEVLFHSFDSDLQNEVAKLGPNAKADVASGIDIIQEYTDFTQGPIRYSGNPQDVAIEGDGFLAVETGNGVYYSRKGNFRINEDLQLVTPEGHKVLNSDGTPVQFEGGIESDSQLGIDEDGTVSVLHGNKRDVLTKLQVVKFAEPQKLQRVGYGLWGNPENVAGVTESTAKVRQRYTELSNTSAVESMVEMIVNQRLYDANANTLKTLNQSLGRLIDSIGG